MIHDGCELGPSRFGCHIDSVASKIFDRRPAPVLHNHTHRMLTNRARDFGKTVVDNIHDELQLLGQ